MADKPTSQLDHFNQGFDLAHYLSQQPPGLSRSVLAVLQRHVGANNVVARKALVVELAADDPACDYRGKDDRAVRAAIAELRRDGWPICSTGGLKGGYYLASNEAELDEYLRRELTARILELREQQDAMRQRAQSYFGRQAAPVQMTMF